MYIIKKTDHKIQNIHDKAWEKAQVAEVMLDSWPDKKVSDYMPNTTARILYSDYGLHISTVFLAPIPRLYMVTCTNALGTWKQNTGHPIMR